MAVEIASRERNQVFEPHDGHAKASRPAQIAGLISQLLENLPRWGKLQPIVHAEFIEQRLDRLLERVRRKGGRDRDRRGFLAVSRCALVSGETVGKLDRIDFTLGLSRDELQQPNVRLQQGYGSGLAE